MTNDNVIPITARPANPEAVPDLRSRQRRFRWFVAALAVVWAGALAAAITYTPFPAIWPLLGFAALVIAAEHRFILFGDETSMSSSIVVILCAVTYWHNDAYLVGPMLVATCGGLLLPHLRTRSFAKIAANSFGMSLAACAAGLAGSIGNLTDPITATWAVVLAVAGGAYWATNNAVVAQYVANKEGASFIRSWKVLATSDTGALWFGIAASALVSLLTTRTSIAILATGLLAYSCNEDSSGRTSERQVPVRLRVFHASESVALVSAVLAAVFSVHLHSWLPFVALAASITAFGARSFLPSTKLNRLGLALAATCVCFSSIPMAILVAGIAAALSQMPTFGSIQRTSAATVAVICSLVAATLAVDGLSGDRPVQLLACFGIAIGSTIGARLLFAGRSVGKLPAMIALGVAIPGRDDFVFASFTVITYVMLWPSSSFSLAAMLVSIAAASAWAPRLHCTARAANSESSQSAVEL